MRQATRLGVSIMLLLTIMCSQNLFAQKAKDVFNADTPLTYLGIDFSNARIIGETSNQAWEIRDKFFASINGVVVNEPKKYDMQKTFQKGYVNFNLDPVMSVNSKAPLEGLMTMNSSDDSRINNKVIADMAREYKLDGKKGVGLVIIMETMNKIQNRASMHFTFVDLASGKVLFTEKVSGKPKGFGFRNFWAGAVHDALQQVQKQHYMVWKNNNS